MSLLMSLLVSTAGIEKLIFQVYLFQVLASIRLRQVHISFYLSFISYVLDRTLLFQFHLDIISLLLLYRFSISMSEFQLTYSLYFRFSIKQIFMLST